MLKGEVGGLTGEKFFDVSELQLISEFHSDVMTTAVEQLVPAFDYVKSSVLGGRPYTRDDHTKVALELKKYITSNMEEKQKALQYEVDRNRSLIDIEREKRVLAEQTAKDTTAQLSRFQQERQEFEEQITKQNNDFIATLKAQLNDVITSNKQRERRLCTGIAILGVCLTLCIWILHSELVTYLNLVLGFDGHFDNFLRNGVQIVGGVILLGSFFPLARIFKPAYRYFAFIAITIFVIVGSDFVYSAQVSVVADILAISTTIAFILSALFDWAKITTIDDT